MMRLSQIAAALDAQLVGPDAAFGSVNTDSRKIQAGDLFIALRGERFDGAEYVASALQSGAVAAMVNRKEKTGFGIEDLGLKGEVLGVQSHDSSSILTPNSSILIVEDTRIALGTLAAFWRKQFDIPLVAITGSNGKTTVKEMLAAILRQQTKENFRIRSLSLRGRVGEGEGTENPDDAVLATRGNFNNDIGMPLTLLRMTARHRYAVIEMGMNHFGEIDYLTRLAQPQVAVVNNASGAHLQGLGTVAGVARAKGEIFVGLDDKGIAVINADDAHANVWRELAGAHPVLDFSLSRMAAVQGAWTAQGYGGVLHAHTPVGDLHAVLQVPGEHNARNALAAASAAIALQIPLAVIARGLENFGGVAGRLQRKQGARGAVLIDDTYNANPASMRAALEVLAQAEGTRIFVLGDMGELGEDAARFHRDIGIAARLSGIEKLYALGEMSKGAVEEFGAGAQHFETPESLCAALAKELDAHTTVLVKGSRFMQMERVISHCVGNEKGEEGGEKGGAVAGFPPSPFPLPSSQAKEAH